MKLVRPAGKECLAMEPSVENDPHATLASLAVLGVSERTLASARRCEWRVLQADLDRFYAFGYGGATQQRFLHSPHPSLAWETPARVLGRVRTAFQRSERRSAPRFTRCGPAEPTPASPAVPPPSTERC
jgi:hypothetical protein